MSILPPTYVRRTVKCSFCGKEFEKSVRIGGDPITATIQDLPLPLRIALALSTMDIELLVRSICPTSDRCPHCGKTYIKVENYKGILFTCKSNN